MSITYAFLTSLTKKADEYRDQMAKYARNIAILPWVGTREEENMDTIKSYLASVPEKDSFVLSEASDIYAAADWEKGIETRSTKSTDGEKVYNVSKLDVYTLDAERNIAKKSYRAEIEGRIDLSRSKPGASTEWWDDIFVASRSSKSYDEERDLFGKTSARQQAIAQFICDTVSFKNLKDVTYNPHRPKEAVDFDPELSAGAILAKNAFIQIAHLENSPWGLGNFLTNVVNDGAFFRSARSRRSGNYFSPPISGIPRHQKPDPFWETTYQLHDYFHQGIPDLIFTGKTSPEHKNVYVAARLMSEALTLVMADMLFIESVKDNGFDYDFTARKISPLFSSLALPDKEKEVQLKTLLHANVAFANLGDEQPYRDMLKGGTEKAFADYAGTYKHFFVQDFLWSADNYNDMEKRKDTFAAWTSMVGKDLFARAKLPLLDDMVDTLRNSGADLSSYETAVMPVFEYIFENVIAPKLKPVQPLSPEEAQSNAFLRYMIGQMSLYAEYRHVNGMQARGKNMAQILRDTSLFTQDEIKRVRDIYRTDLQFLKDQKIITPDDFGMFKQIHPIFAPRFLSYDFDKTPYDSVKEAIGGVFGQKKR
jgi:hypothetical protein